MKRFLSQHYDATGYSSPSNQAAMDSREATYVTNANLIRTHYEDDLAETISNYYVTPTSTFLVMTGDLVVTTPGTYTFKLTTTSGVTDLLINDTLVSASYANSGVGTYYTKGGILNIKLRFIGSSSAGSFSTTWLQPEQVSYSTIPNINRPFYGSTLFPFDIYDSVTENMKQDYKVIGDLQQKQTKYTTSEPYKTFSVTLKQNNVYDRLKVKAWFDSVKGKLKTFMFDSRRAEFTLAEPIVAGNTSIVVNKAYTTIAYSYIKKLIYFPAIGFATQIVDTGEKVVDGKGSCDELFLADSIPELPEGNCEVTFLYFCRLDTDTLTFELDDIDFSSVKFPMIELYNDNYITNLQ